MHQKLDEEKINNNFPRHTSFQDADAWYSSCACVNSAYCSCPAPFEPASPTLAGDAAFAVVTSSPLFAPRRLSSRPQWTKLERRLPRFRTETRLHMAREVRAAPVVRVKVTFTVKMPYVRVFRWSVRGELTVTLAMTRTSGAALKLGKNTRLAHAWLVYACSGGCDQANVLFVQEAMLHLQLLSSARGLHRQCPLWWHAAWMSPV